MDIRYRKYSSVRRQGGVALIVALILLLVMTMVAVVAMRSTTLDLKMTTNTTLGRRAFQTSEGSRMSLGPVLDSHVFYRGWPDSLTGGTVPSSAVFTLPGEVNIQDATKEYYMGENGTFSTAHSVTPRNADVLFRADVDSDNNLDADDMFSSIWVSRVASLPATGSGAAQGSGYLGPGVGAAGAGAHVFLDLLSDGEGVGNAEVRTGADYRVLVRN